MLPKGTKTFLAELIGWERAWKSRHWIDPHWSGGYINLHLPHRKILVEKILESKPKIVLEIGCGMGVNLELLRSISPTIKLFGVDTSSYIIKRARLKFPHIFFGVGNFEKHPYPHSHFDVVFTSDSFIYAKDQRVALRKMCEISNRVIMYEWNQYLEVTK